MKVFVVITISRQIEGEYVFIKTEKAFTRASKAEELAKKLKSNFVDSEGKIKPVRIATSDGEAVCMGEIGIFDVELEDDTENEIDKGDK